MALAQLQILNKVLDSKDFSLISANGLTADYFYLYKQEFNYIKTHYEKYGAVPDKETFVSTFREFDLIDVAEPDSYLLEAAERDYRQQYLTTAFNSMAALLRDGKVDDATSLFKRSADGMAACSAMKAADLFGDAGSRYADYVERTKDFGRFYVSTGFPELDEKIGGWDREEEYAVVAARTNNGKSYITLKMAIAAAEQGLRVGLYSGEMSVKKVGYRADSLISHLPNGYLAHGNVSVQKDYEAFIKALPGMFKGTIKVFTPSDVSGPVTVDTLRTFIESESLDMLVIDQVSLLKDAKGGRSATEAAANISQDIKLLQGAKRIPIIAVSQLNRTSNDDPGDDSISTTMLSQSDRFSQDATTIIGIIRDKKDESVLKLQIVKARDGHVGEKLTYRCDLGVGRFDFVPTEEAGAPAVADMAKRYMKPSGPGDVF